MQEFVGESRESHEATSPHSELCDQGGPSLLTPRASLVGCGQRVRQGILNQSIVTRTGREQVPQEYGHQAPEEEGDDRNDVLITDFVAVSKEGSTTLANSVCETAKVSGNISKVSGKISDQIKALSEG